MFWDLQFVRLQAIVQFIFISVGLDLFVTTNF